MASDSHTNNCTWAAPPNASYDVFDCPLNTWANSTEEYCLLHGNSSDGQKPQDEVRAAVEQLTNHSDEVAEIDLRGLADGSTLDFSNIDVYDSAFCDATLEGADLRTKFKNVDFTGANLSEADCRGASFRGCTLNETTLRKTDFRKGKTTCYNTSFINASCNNTFFQGTTLKKSDFTDATLTETKLAGSQCEKVDFTQTDIFDGSFQGSTCSEADFTDATIQSSGFQGAKLDKADFSGARIADVKYWGSNLKDAMFSGCVISDTSFVRADLQSALFIDATIGRKTTFREANLEDMNFSTVRLGSDVYFGARLLQEYKADYRAGWQRVWNCISNNVNPLNFSIGPSYVLATASGEVDSEPAGKIKDTDRENTDDRSLLALTESNKWEDVPNCIQDSPPESSLEPLYDRKLWFRCTSRWYWYAATIFPGLISTCSEEVDELYDESERLYGAIEAGYAGTASGQERRRFNIRQNATRQKQLGFGYVRQQLLKRTMLYGESPAQVLRFTSLIILFTSVAWVGCGVNIEGQSVHIGYPSEGIIQSGKYWIQLAEHAVRQLIGVGSTQVTPQGVVGQWLETTLAVIGNLLFAIFVYTLGRRATT
ncbi:pentapeptide repeat-containing protein [Halorubrum sp. FL23]|uniref:pentapeptide repeat-containing protein n=1 Tax=Halorubrum sp. FL23 TaxID=3458704 RepID=UPI00403420BC